MTAVRVAAAIAGAALLLLVLFDGFSTVILARRSEPALKLTRLFFLLTWTPYAAIGRRIRNGGAREDYLSAYGPLSILGLLACWAGGLVVSFGLLQWSAGLHFGGNLQSFPSDLTFSGHAALTMIPAEPRNPVSQFLTILEAAVGFSFLGLVIGYLPVLYQSFSSRESKIMMLDARAGSPPSAVECLARQSQSEEKLESFLAGWEDWTAELLQHQLSYPMLAFFRSQHDNQSWLASLVAVLDLSAIVYECGRGELKRQAGLTFAMGRHAVVDVARLFGVRPSADAADRLPPDEFTRLKERLASRRSPVDMRRLAEDRLRETRERYEPLSQALSRHFLMALPPWLPPPKADNWERTDIDSTPGTFAVSDPFQVGR